MAPFRVLEHLDLVEDVGAGICAGGVDLAADALALEQLEEALGDGVCRLTCHVSSGHSFLENGPRISL